MQPIKKILFAILATPLVATTFLATPATAQEGELVNPEPLSLNGRFMPGFGNEAIVKARYTVKADGTTDDIQLFGYLSNQFLNTMLRQTVKDWTFRPGTVNGEAVDVYNQEWIFALRVDPNAPPMQRGGPGGRGGRSAPPAPENAEPVDFSNLPVFPLALSPQMKDAVDEISALVGAGNYDKALKEVDKLARNLRTVFDYSLTQELRTSILMAKNEHFEALDASRLATMYALDARGEKMWFLEDSVLETALRKKFLLAAMLRQNGLAWETYEILQEKFDVPADDQIHAGARTVKAQLDSPEPLGMLAGISDDKLWTHTPVRRIFTVTDVNGKLDRINARCERRNLELKYQADVDWTLPESLGQCELDFVGRNGTRFTLYEFRE